MTDSFPYFPPPTPLRRSALVRYAWGKTRFEFLCAAGSLRSTPWGEESVTWLHCKGVQTASIKDGEGSLMQLLIPAHYITYFAPGPTLRATRTRRSDDFGVFVPNQPAPADALPLDALERALADLLTSERN